MKKPMKIISLTLGSIFLILFLFWIFRLEILDHFLSKDVIFWDENVEITYSDFEAEIDKNSEYDIFYYHAFYLKGNDVETANVRSFFDKSKSWAKDTTNYDFATENKLQKIRFDIYEVYARKFNLRIKELQKKEGAKFSDLTKVGDSLYEQINYEIDKLYAADLSIEEKIKVWRPKVDEMLKQNKK